MKKTLSAKKLHGDSSEPVILHFQPETFHVLDDKEDLKKWEDLVANKVLPVSNKNLVQRMRNTTGTRCESNDNNS